MSERSKGRSKMKTRTKLVTAITVGAAVIAGTAGLVVAQQGDNDDWVKPDGTVDMKKFPERFPVPGPDGKPLRDDKGQLVTVNPRELSCEKGKQRPPGSGSIVHLKPEEFCSSRDLVQGRLGS